MANKQEFEQILDNKFDEKLVNFATKDDLKSLEQRIDLKFENQTKELKQFAEDQTEHLAQIIATTVAIPLEKHKRSCQQIRA